MRTPTRHDRRNRLRGFISMPVSLEVGEGAIPWAAETLNLSEGGALLRTNARLAPGTPAKLRFAFDSAVHGQRVYEAGGRVARAYADDVVALAFDDVSDDLRTFARALIGWS